MSMDVHYEYVVEPDDNLICSICREPFNDPVTTTSCRHTFCRACVEEALNADPSCPLDRAPLSRRDLVDSGPAFQMILDDLKVRCIAPGCGQIYERSLQVSHQATCELVITTCPNDGCDESMRRGDLAEHLAVLCSKRQMECEVCKGTITRSNIFKHQHTTPAASSVNADVQCSLCGQMTARQGTAAHRWTCPKVRVSCPHARHGCPTAMPRDTLGHHVATCPYIHFAKFIVDTNRRLNALENRPRHDTRQLSRVHQTLEVMRDRVDPMWDLIGTSAQRNRQMLSYFDAVGQVELPRQFAPASGQWPSLNGSASSTSRGGSRYSSRPNSDPVIRELIQEYFSGPPPNRPLTHWETRSLRNFTDERLNEVPRHAPPMAEPSRTRTTTEMHARPGLIDPSSPHVRAPHANVPTARTGHIPTLLSFDDPRTYYNPGTQPPRHDTRTTNADGRHEASHGGNAALPSPAIRVFDPNGDVSSRSRVSVAAGQSQQSRVPISVPPPAPRAISRWSTASDHVTRPPAGDWGFPRRSASSFRDGSAGDTTFTALGQPSTTAGTAATQRVQFTDNQTPLIDPVSHRPAADGPPGDAAATEPATVVIDGSTIGQQRPLIEAIPPVRPASYGGSEGQYIQSVVDASSVSETAGNQRTQSPEDWVHLSHQDEFNHTPGDAEGDVRDANEGVGSFQGLEDVSRPTYPDSRVSTGSRSLQPFADLAFSRFGHPGNPAAPSGPEEIDDQLGDLRNVVYRLAEGMDTMERQSQARIYTENLRVQEEVNSLRAIVHVMRNQVMMGNNQATFTQPVPQTPTSPSSTTPTAMPSPETNVRESIAFSSQHADLDGPGDTSSISSLVTANPIRQQRGSLFSRRHGQPMGIPPELDDGAPTVRVQVLRSVPRMESAERTPRPRTSVLDMLHLRGSRSSRHFASQ